MCSAPRKEAIILDYVDLGATRLGPTSATDVTKITGLTGIPSGIRGDLYDRPEADGSVEPANQYLTHRTIVIEGEVWGASVDAAWTAWNTLEGVLFLAVQTQQTLKWRRAGGTLDVQALVRLADSQPPVLSADEQGPFIKYQVTLRADDPLVYDQVSQAATATAPSTSATGMPLPMVFPIPFGLAATGGTCSVLNGGNAPSWPVITVTGPITNPVLGNATTARYLYFDGLTLAAGETLIVTTAPNLRGAAQAGVSKLGALRFSDSVWPSATNGVTETWQLYTLAAGSTNGGTTMQVSWRNSYVS